MKKRIIPLLLVNSFLSFTLSSCSVSDSNIYIRKAENVSHTFLLSSVSQLNSIARYEDAVIFISRTGCHYCEGQREYLNVFIQNTDSVIYEVERTTYLEAYDDPANEMGDYAYLYPKVTGYPTFLFYKEGKLKDSHVGELAHSQEEFDTNFGKKIKQQNLYMLNDFTTETVDGIYYHELVNSESKEETKSLDTEGYTTENLDKKISTGKNTVLYTWRRCGDCKSLRTNLLNSYLSQHEDLKLYYYEVDGYYLLKRQTEETLQTLGLNMWSEFSSKYHLYNDYFYNIDSLGNKAGYAPTLVSYTEGTYSSMNVFLNESNIQRKEDGTLSYGMYFNEDIKSLTSNSKVEAGDITSETYQKAVNELSEKAKDIDLKQTEAYLDSLL